MMRKAYLMCVPAASRLQARLCYIRAGTLDVEEFRHLVRVGLRLTASDVSDVELDKLVAALDADAGGEHASARAT